MKKLSDNKKMSEEQVKARNRRVTFLVLTILSGFGAVLALHAPTPAEGTAEFALLGCVCGLLVGLFILSGIGFFVNLFQWMREE